MDLTSTPFLSYSEINVEDTDLYDDAWGFNSEFNDVISLLGDCDTSACNSLAEKLITVINSR